jgi:flagellar motor switch protein FliN/FliY
MPEEELNDNNPEMNDPPENVSDEEASADQQQAAGAETESGSENIEEPTMDESSALGADESSSDAEESTAESSETEEESSPDDTGELSQEEIDKAFEAVNGSGAETGAENAGQADANIDDGVADTQSGPGVQSEIQQSDGEFNVVRSKEFEDFGKPESGKGDQRIEMLLDVTLPIAIELGRTSMPIQDILNLGPGSVVELNRLAGEPVDLLVNDKLIAKGEVVVVDENFGVRVTNMVSQEERLKSLR